MSSAEVDACVEILEDHFGGLVASVGRVLLGGEATFAIIALRLRKLNVGLVKYHEQFEKSKGQKIEIADDPELTRHLRNTKVQSQVSVLFTLTLHHLADAVV
uniref:Uncharacterized protein n=1 Tax=Parascaris univalens TaxID=6257 RepID=A0A915CKD3_PARUN